METERQDMITIWLATANYIGKGGIILSADMILNYLGQCDKERKLEFHIVCQCAPVLKGVKISNIVTVAAGAWKTVKRTLAESRIICVPLFVGKEKDVIFLYRYEEMAEHLKNENVRRFMEEYGYIKPTVESVIFRLRRRYQDYSEGKAGFPHELGVLLEYPLEDVLGFIQNQGKNCLLCRYWKVYHNKERAKEIFRQYDEARECAMKEMIAGCPLKQVASS
ncbi:DUF3793 family protein [Clostridium sp. MCC353]|nr:DUF3793 family protein [Clostridium sp. MCC353]